jgi:guanylate kinase
LAHAGEYQHQVINDDLESAVADLRVIVGGLFPKS